MLEKTDMTFKMGCLTNEAANVLATPLSNQVTLRRHIGMLVGHYDVVFVYKKRSLFHQEDHLISRISCSRDKQ